jgi:hypothetical protein
MSENRTVRPLTSKAKPAWSGRPATVVTNLRTVLEAPLAVATVKVTV